MCIENRTASNGEFHEIEVDAVMEEIKPYRPFEFEKHGRCLKGHLLLEMKTMKPSAMFCRSCRHFVSVARTYGCCICDYSICLRCHPANETAEFLRGAPDNIVLAIVSSLPARGALQVAAEEMETVPPRRMWAVHDLRALLEIDASHDLVLKRGAESCRCHRAIVWARVPQMRERIEASPEKPDCLMELEIPEIPGGSNMNIADEVRRIYTGGKGNSTGVFADLQSGPDALACDLKELLLAGSTAPGLCELISRVQRALTAHFSSVTPDGELASLGRQDSSPGMPVGVVDSTALWIIQAICIDALPICRPLCRMRKCTEKNAAHHPDAIVGVWQAAHHWGMHAVAALAEEALARHINMRTCLVILGWAEDRGAAYVVRMAYSFLREHFEVIAVSNRGVLERISTSHLIRLLSEDALNASHEATVLKAVLDWALASPVRGDSPEVQELLHDFWLNIPRRREQVLPELLRRVRLPLLDPGPSSDYSQFLDDRQTEVFFASCCRTLLSTSAWLHSDDEAKERHIREGRLYCLPRLTMENTCTVRLEAVERQRVARLKLERENEIAHI